MASSGQAFLSVNWLSLLQLASISMLPEYIAVWEQKSIDFWRDVHTRGCYTLGNLPGCLVTSPTPPCQPPSNDDHHRPLRMEQIKVRIIALLRPAQPHVQRNQFCIGKPPFRQLIRIPQHSSIRIQRDLPTTILPCCNAHAPHQQQGQSLLWLHY